MNEPICISDNKNIHVKWQPVEDADYYIVQVGKYDGEFLLSATNPPLNDFTWEDEFTVETPYGVIGNNEPQAGYGIRVKAVSNYEVLNTDVEWSDIGKSQMFNLETPNIFKVDSEDKDVLLFWEKVKGAHRYQVVRYLKPI